MPGSSRQLGRQETALQHSGGSPFHFQLTGLDRGGHPVGDAGEQVRLGFAEVPFGETPDVEHPEQLAAAQERDPEHGTDPLFPQERVGHGGRVDPVRGPPAVGWPRSARRSRVPTGSRTPWRTSSSIPHAARATSWRGGLVEEQHRHRVHPHQPRDPLEQLGEQVVDVEMAERRRRSRPRWLAVDPRLPSPAQMARPGSSCGAPTRQHGHNIDRSRHRPGGRCVRSRGTGGAYGGLQMGPSRWVGEEDIPTGATPSPRCYTRVKIAGSRRRRARCSACIRTQSTTMTVLPRRTRPTSIPGPRQCLLRAARDPIPGRGREGPPHTRRGLRIRSPL